MRRPRDHAHKPPSIQSPTTMDAAFRAAAFRAELDALLTKHGMRLVLAHEGKWAHLQGQWPGIPDCAVSFMRVTRGGRIRYLLEAEDQ